VAGKKLAQAVYVSDPETGESTFYDAGDTPEARFAKHIGEHAYTAADVPPVPYEALPQ